MPTAKNPLKWQGAEALAELGLCQFKLPGTLGRTPVFYRAQSEITPFFLFTPHLKWGAVYTGGLLGLSFTGIGDFVNSFGKLQTAPPVMIHTANFPGQLARYIDPEEAERGEFEVWAALVDRCLRLYPTSAEELRAQLLEGRLGGFRAAQQLHALGPNAELAGWLAEREISIPPAAPFPIEAASAPSSSIQ